MNYVSFFFFFKRVEYFLESDAKIFIVIGEDKNFSSVFLFRKYKVWTWKLIQTYFEAHSITYWEIQIFTGLVGVGVNP